MPFCHALTNLGITFQNCPLDFTCLGDPVPNAKISFRNLIPLGLHFQYCISEYLDPLLLIFFGRHLSLPPFVRPSRLFPDRRLYIKGFLDGSCLNRDGGEGGGGFDSFDGGARLYAGSDGVAQEHQSSALIRRRNLQNFKGVLSW